MSDAEVRATAVDWLWDQLDAAFTADELEPPAADEPPGVLRVHEALRRTTVLWGNRAAATDAEIVDVRRLIDSAAVALAEASALCAFLAALCDVIAGSRHEPSPPAAASDAPWSHFSHVVRARLYRASPDIAATVARCDACLNLYVASLTSAIPAVSAALAEAFLEMSGDGLAAAVDQQRWVEATHLLGSYVAVGNARAKEPADGARRAGVEFPRYVGWMLGRAHERQAHLLGAPLSPESIAFDVAIHHRGDEWDEFAMGYGPPIDRTAVEAELKPAEHDEVGRPRYWVHDRLDIAVYARTLQGQEDVHRDLVDRAARLENLEQAVALACDAAAIDNGITASACEHAYHRVLSLFHEERFGEVVAALDSALPRLEAALTPAGRASFDGLHLLSLSRISAEEDFAGLVIAGCDRLLETGDSALAAFCTRTLRPLISIDSLAPDRGELIRALTRCALRRVHMEQSLGPLREVARDLHALAEAPELDESGRSFVDAARVGASALLALTEGALGPEPGAAVMLVVEHPDLEDLLELLVRFTPRPGPEAVAARGDDTVGAATSRALLAEDWPAAVAGARGDLDALGARGDRTLLVGILARALRGVADTARDAAERAAARAEIRALLDAEGAILLRAPSTAVWRLAAGNLGLAVVATSAQQVPQQALELLERAAESTPRDGGPDYAGCLHDLAHACGRYADSLPPESAFAMRERAAALFREVLVLHRRLRRELGGVIAVRDRPEATDYLNLGFTYHSLSRYSGAADREQAGEDIGPLYTRAAIWVLAAGRDRALASGRLMDAARARRMLAEIKKDLAITCLEHTRETGGTFKRAFMHHLAVVERVPFTTWDFATRYGLSALAELDAALGTVARDGDRGELMACLHAAFRILGVTELRHGVKAGAIGDDNYTNMREFRRTVYGVLYEMLPTAIGRDPAIDQELEGWRRYLAAQMEVEHRGGTPASLEMAAADLAQLRRGSDPILRAFARPFADWFAIQRAGGTVAVNGLGFRPTPAGLEITLLAQRRSFILEGLTVDRLSVVLQEASTIKRESTGALTSLMPQIDWSNVPSVVPVLAGVGTPEAASATFLATRLPARGWDVWVLHIYVPAGETLRLAARFAVHEQRDETVVLDAPGMTVEVSARYGATCEAVPSAEGMILRLGAGETRIALRSAPTVVDSEAALLVRDDSPYAGACCAAASSTVAPTLNIPSALIRSYSPLFMFRDAVDERVVTYLRDSSHRQLVVVGAPDDEEAIVGLLMEIQDPRRDIVFILERGEIERVRAAVATLRSAIEARCATPQYSIAASPDDPLGGGVFVQIIDAPRQLAPATVQIVLDLIGFRRLPAEDIPTGGGDSPYRFELIGSSPAVLRRAMTRLDDEVGWDDLVETYCKLTDDLALEWVGKPSPELLELSRPLPKREVLIVPDEPAVILAATPYARHHGALLLVDNDRAWQLVAKLRPARVHCVGEVGNGRYDGSVVQLPADHRGIAQQLTTVARSDHQARVDALEDAGLSGTVDGLLLQLMRPSDYVVIASLSTAERQAAALAANYSATLGSPLLLFDDEQVFSAEARTLGARLLAGASVTRDARPRVAPEGHGQRQIALTELERALNAIHPTYIGFVSSRMTIPVELAGSEPLGTRYAVGRLTAPDATALAFLISSAALREEVPGEAQGLAVVVDAADAVERSPLPEARIEAREVAAMLDGRRGIRVEPIAGADDRQRFLAAVERASIVHFSGHGSYQPNGGHTSGLVFTQALLRPDDVPSLGRASPIVFANACSSGATHSAEAVGRAWSGLAASFIDAGALNYLGSLWPIIDSSSRQLAERFYDLLVQGYSVGESLRQAKRDMFRSDDPTWAAVILFGCPRTRFTSADPKLA